MSDGFAEYVKDCFSQFCDVTVRKMFGGYGVYLDSVIIGLIADDVLYLKVDKNCENEYQVLGSKQFEYSRGDKMYKMSYWSISEDLLESGELEFYVNLAYEVSLNTKK